MSYLRYYGQKLVNPSLDVLIEEIFSVAGIAFTVWMLIVLTFAFVATRGDISVCLALCWDVYYRDEHDPAVPELM